MVCLCKTTRFGKRRSDSHIDPKDCYSRKKYELHNDDVFILVSLLNGQYEVLVLERLMIAE